MKGYIQITQIDTLHGHGELGICIAPEARGQGFGTEALLLIEAHASRLFDLRKITLRVFASHKPAIALYTKGGYSEVGVLREHFYQNNHRHDVLIMEKSLGSPSRSK